MTGKRVLLLYPSGLDFIAAFMGCLYGGAIAVPAYPPLHQRQAGRVQGVDPRPLVRRRHGGLDALQAVARTDLADQDLGG